MKNITCHYCGNNAKLVRGSVIYPHIPYLKNRYYYLCKPCGAYVGCHGNTTNPLGILANNELRKEKGLAHTAFDKIWREKLLTRKEAYKWLSEKLDIPINKCHIGMFDISTCKKVVEIVNKYKGELSD